MDLYDPDSQAVQTVPSPPAYPTLHLHCVMAVLADNEVEPPGQVVQTSTETAPTLPEYVLAGHSLQLSCPIIVL